MEQALCKMVYVEIVDGATMSENKKSELEYVQRMHEPVALFDVPNRIIQRYFENAQFLVKSVKAIF